jgi:hypothetical protein
VQVTRQRFDIKVALRHSTNPCKKRSLIRALCIVVCLRRSCLGQVASGERESSNRTARSITKHRCPTIPANPSIFFALNSLHPRRRELRAKKNADHFR